MKKSLFACVLTVICSLSTTAFAAGAYTEGESTYTDDIINGANTVVIYKGTAEADLKDENIYYIDQCNTEDGFTSFRAILKVNTPAGVYTVATNDAQKTATFEVSPIQEAISGASTMEFLDAQVQSNDSSKYSVAFTLSAEDGLSLNSKMIMVLNDVAYTIDMFGSASPITWNLPSIDGHVSCAIQFDDVDASYMTVADKATPNFKIYFRK